MIQANRRRLITNEDKTKIESKRIALTDRENYFFPEDPLCKLAHLLIITNMLIVTTRCNQRFVKKGRKSYCTEIEDGRVFVRKMTWTGLVFLYRLLYEPRSRVYERNDNYTAIFDLLDFIKMNVTSQWSFCSLRNCVAKLRFQIFHLRENGRRWEDRRARVCLFRILAKPEEFAELAYKLVIGSWLTVTRVLFQSR